MTKMALKKKAQAGDWTSVAATHLLLGAFGTDIKYRVEGPDGDVIEKDISKLTEDDVILVTAQKPDGTVVQIPEEEAKEQGLEIIHSGEVAQKRIDSKQMIEVYKGPELADYMKNAAASIQEIIALGETTKEEKNHKTDKIVKFYMLYGDRKKFTVDDYITKFKDGTITALLTPDFLKEVHKVKFKNFSKVYNISVADYEANKDMYVPAYLPEVDENKVIKLDANGRAIPKIKADGTTTPVIRTVDKEGTTNFLAIQKQAKKFAGKDIEYIINYFAGNPNYTRVNVKTVRNVVAPVTVAPKPIIPSKKDIKVIKTEFNQFKNFTQNLKETKVKEIYESRKFDLKSYNGLTFTLSEIETIAKDSSDDDSITKDLLATKPTAFTGNITELKTWADREFEVSMFSINTESALEIRKQKEQYIQRYFKDLGLDLIGDTIYADIKSPKLVQTNAIKKYSLNKKDKKQALKQVKEEVEKGLATQFFLEPIISLSEGGFKYNLDEIKEEVDLDYAIPFLENYSKYNGIYFFKNGTETELTKIDIKTIKAKDIYETIEKYQGAHLAYKNILKQKVNQFTQQFNVRLKSERAEFIKRETEEMGGFKKSPEFKKALEDSIDSFDAKKEKEKAIGIREAKKDVINFLSSTEKSAYERSLVYFNPKKAVNSLSREKIQALKENIQADRVKLSDLYDGMNEFEAYSKYLEEAKDLSDKIPQKIPFFLSSGKKASDIKSIFNSVNKTFSFVITQLERLPTTGVNSPISSVKQKNLDTLIKEQRALEAEMIRKQTMGYQQQPTQALEKVKKKIKSLRSEIKNLNKPIDFLVDSITLPRTNRGSESSVSPWGSLGYQSSKSLREAKNIYQEKQDVTPFAKLVAKLVSIGLYNILKQAKMFNAFMMKGGIKEEVDYEEFFDNIIEEDSNSNSAIKSGLKTNIETALNNFSLKAGAATVYPLKQLGVSDPHYISLKSNFEKVLSGEITKEEFTYSVADVVSQMESKISAQYPNISKEDISISNLIKGVCSSKAVDQKEVASRATSMTIKNVFSTSAKSKNGDEEIDTTDFGSYLEYEENRMNSENSRRDVKKCISYLSEDSDLALELISLFGTDSYISSKSLSGTAEEVSKLTSVIYIKEGGDFESFAEKGSIDFNEVNEIKTKIYNRLSEEVLNSPRQEELKSYLGVYGKVDLATFDKTIIKDLQELESKIDEIFSEYGVENVDYFRLFGGRVNSYLQSVVLNYLHPLGYQKPAMEMNVKIKNCDTKEKLALDFIKYGLRKEAFEFNYTLKSSDIQELFYAIFKQTFDLAKSSFEGLSDSDKADAITKLLNKTIKDDNIDHLINFLKSHLCLPTNEKGVKLSKWILKTSEKDQLKNAPDVLEAFIDLAEKAKFYDTTAKLTVGDFSDELLDKIGASFFNNLFEKNFGNQNKVLESKINSVLRENSLIKASKDLVEDLNYELGTEHDAKKVFDDSYKIQIPADLSNLILSTSLKMYSCMLLLDLANGDMEILKGIFNQEESWWKLFSFTGKQNAAKLSYLVRLYKTKLKQLGRALDSHEALEKHIESTFRAAPTKFNTSPEVPEETKEEKQISINNIVLKEISSFFDKRQTTTNSTLGIGQSENKVSYIYETLNKLHIDGIATVIKNSIDLQELVSGSELKSLIDEEGFVTEKGNKTVEKLVKIRGALPKEIRDNLESKLGQETYEKITEEIASYITELRNRYTLLNEVKKDTSVFLEKWQAFSKFSFETISFSEIFGFSTPGAVAKTLNSLDSSRKVEYLEDAQVAITNEVGDIRKKKAEIIRTLKEDSYKKALEYVYGQNNKVLAIIGKQLLGLVSDRKIKHKTTKEVVLMILNTMINKA